MIVPGEVMSSMKGIMHLDLALMKGNIKSILHLDFTFMKGCLHGRHALLHDPFHVLLESF